MHRLALFMVGVFGSVGGRQLDELNQIEIEALEEGDEGYDAEYEDAVMFGLPGDGCPLCGSFACDGDC